MKMVFYNRREQWLRRQKMYIGIYGEQSIGPERAGL